MSYRADKSNMRCVLTLKLNLTFNVPKINKDLNQGSYLVILAWTGIELSCGQASDRHTDWHTNIARQTHTEKQPTTIPVGQHWPRVKVVLTYMCSTYKAHTRQYTFCIYYTTCLSYPWYHSYSAWYCIHSRPDRLQSNFERKTCDCLFLRRTTEIYIQ